MFIIYIEAYTHSLSLSLSLSLCLSVSHIAWRSSALKRLTFFGITAIQGSAYIAQWWSAVMHTYLRDKVDTYIP